MTKKALAPSKSVTTRGKKGRKFMSIVGDAYDKANLSEKEAQCVNEALGLAKLLGKFITINRYANLLTKSEQLATNILGSRKVAGCCDAVRVWNTTMLETEPTMPFSEEVLRQCAEENKRGTADWRLIYINGFSLRKQEEIRGRNCKNKPCFDPDHTWWWLRKEQESWGNQSVEAGYRLLDFSGRYRNRKWEIQEDEIAKLGESYERAEEQAVAEACFTFYLISGKRERLLKDWWHWGKLQVIDGYYVLVGYFDRDGFSVHFRHDFYYCAFYMVVLSRKSN